LYFEDHAPDLTRPIAVHICGAIGCQMLNPINPLGTAQNEISQVRGLPTRCTASRYVRPSIPTASNSTMCLELVGRICSHPFTHATGLQAPGHCLIWYIYDVSTNHVGVGISRASYMREQSQIGLVKLRFLVTNDLSRVRQIRCRAILQI
jgi:hypothetical protein